MIIAGGQIPKYALHCLPLAAILRHTKTQGAHHRSWHHGQSSSLSSCDGSSTSRVTDDGEIGAPAAVFRRGSPPIRARAMWSWILLPTESNGEYGPPAGI